MAYNRIWGTTSDLSGWTKKSGGINISTNYEYGLNGEGYHVASSNAFNTTTTYSDSYEADLSGTLEAPILGTTGNICVTSVSLTKSAGAKATMSVTSHEHEESPSANGTYTLDLSAYINGGGFGACTPPIGDAVSDGSVVSWSLSASLQHEELGDCSGDHLDAESYDPTIDVTVEVVGDTPLALNATNLAAGWEFVSSDVGEKSPGFTTATMAAKLHLAKTP